MDAQTTGDITKFTAQKETDSTAAPFRHQKKTPEKGGKHLQD
jgi:hypothetical protein